MHQKDIFQEPSTLFLAQIVVFASVIMKTTKEFHIVSVMKVFTVQYVNCLILISLIQAQSPI